MEQQNELPLLFADMDSGARVMVLDDLFASMSQDYVRDLICNPRSLGLHCEAWCSHYMDDRDELAATLSEDDFEELVELSSQALLARQPNPFAPRE
jgi:hypothetical protein